jgi:DNA invertase Pin-like site-specific DNA recombinase
LEVSMEYVIYKRVSTNKQGDSGLGLDAQQRDLALYLDNYADEGSTVLDTFTDVMSGAQADRPELSAALDLVRRTGATLLVSKLDRLSRKVSFIAALTDDKKVSLKVASMPNADKFQLHLYAALAEQERSFISLRTRAALKEAKARGVKLGGLRDKTLQRNEVVKANADLRAAKIKSLILPMRANNATLTEIADALGAANVSTARGGKWTAKQVSRTLQRLDAAYAA